MPASIEICSSSCAAWSQIPQYLKILKSPLLVCQVLQPLLNLVNNLALPEMMDVTLNLE